MTLEGPEGNALAKGEAAASSQRPPCSPSGGAILLRSPQAASGNQRRRSGELYDGKTGAAPMLFARPCLRKEIRRQAIRHCLPRPRPPASRTDSQGGLAFPPRSREPALGNVKDHSCSTSSRATDPSAPKPCSRSPHRRHPKNLYDFSTKPRYYPSKIAKARPPNYQCASTSTLILLRSSRFTGQGERSAHSPVRAIS